MSAFVIINVEERTELGTSDIDNI